MNDYCNGIAYASGSFTVEDNRKYLIVRNLDSWYVKTIEKESKYKAYKSNYNIERDRKSQWTIKARDVESIPSLSALKNVNDFCRAYIEIHGLLDLATARDRKGNYFKKPRLRIYGTEEIISFLNSCLPANKKTIQYINNIVDNIYVGKTCALYYQSVKEITNILKWIDGEPKNERIWIKWKEIIDLE